MLYIVGPHLSGTTIVASILNCAGIGPVPTGDLVKYRAQDKVVLCRNHESTDIRFCNELLLKLVDTGFNQFNPPPYDDLIHVKTEVDPCEYITDYKVVSDPLFCLTLPLWLECTTKDPTIVYLYREPADIADHWLVFAKDNELYLDLSRDELIKLINLYYGYADLTENRFIRDKYVLIRMVYDNIFNVKCDAWQEIGSIYNKPITEQHLTSVKRLRHLSF